MLAVTGGAQGGDEEGGKSGRGKEEGTQGLPGGRRWRSRKDLSGLAGERGSDGGRKP